MSLAEWRGYLSENTYPSRLQKHMDSVSLAPAIFGISCVRWTRHGTNKSVCDCRNKQNYSSYNKTVRRSDHGHTVDFFNFYNSPDFAQFRKYKIKQTVLGLYMLI
jgi:hypothetical protein